MGIIQRDPTTFILFYSLSSSLHSIRCVATVEADSDCTSSWFLHAGEFSAGARLHSGAFTLTECQKACEFDPRCVAADWHTARRQCWITTDPNYSHHHRTPRDWEQNGYHYHLVSRCNITKGQCFHEILSC